MKKLTEEDLFDIFKDNLQEFINSLKSILFESIRESINQSQEFENNFCYGVIDENHNIIKLFTSYEKAYSGMKEFIKSHPEVLFYVETVDVH
jgi:hypothetical protein